MRVLFFITTFGSKPKYHPGIASLSAVLEKAGHKTALLAPNSLDFAFVKDYIDGFRPDVIAVSTNSHQYHHVKEFLPFIRGNFKDVKIILGGVHPTLNPDVINEIKEADAVCRGEGELPLLRYIDSLENKKGDYTIPNISFKTGEGVKENRISCYVEDLNTLPYPNYSIFPKFKKSKKLDFPMRFLFNRGCPFNCTYCCNHTFKELFPESKNYVRYKSPERIIEEILYFSDVYDFDHYVVDDDIFTLNKKLLLEFCGLYPERLKKKTFEVNVRVGTADREMLKALKETGCSLIKIGVESGSEPLRKKILGRGISQDAIVQTADLIKSVGLELHTFNMVGVPGETRRDVWKTIGLNRKISPDKTQLTVFYPYKNTVLGDYCYEGNLVKPKQVDSYFTESIIKLKPGRLTKFEVDHFVSLFKFYVYFARNHRMAWKAFIRGLKDYLARLKRIFTNAYHK